MANITCVEAARILDPPMLARQVRTLVALAGIPVAGRCQPNGRGRPPNLYNADHIITEHATEAARTAKQFIDNDWIAAGLLGRALIIADPDAGTLHWPDGERAEVMGPDIYGLVHVGPEVTPAHRVIWIASDGPIPEGIQINHINRRRWDNRRTNLELVTFVENVQHGYGKPYITHTAAVAELAAMTDPERQGNGVQAGSIVPAKRSVIRLGWN